MLAAVHHHLKASAYFPRSASEVVVLARVFGAVNVMYFNVATREEKRRGRRASPHYDLH